MRCFWRARRFRRTIRVGREAVPLRFLLTHVPSQGITTLSRTLRTTRDRKAGEPLHRRLVSSAKILGTDSIVATTCLWSVSHQHAIPTQLVGVAGTPDRASTRPCDIGCRNGGLTGVRGASSSCVGLGSTRTFCATVAEVSCHIAVSLGMANSQLGYRRSVDKIKVNDVEFELEHSLRANGKVSAANIWCRTRPGTGGGVSRRTACCARRP